METLEYQNQLVFPDYRQLFVSDIFASDQLCIFKTKHIFTENKKKWKMKLRTLGVTPKILGMVILI